MPHPCDQSDEQLLKDCVVERGRRGGPGGQHRNKVETAIRIRHQPTQVTAEATEKRSQEANRKAALLRLKIALACRIRSSRDSVTSIWARRVHDRRLRISVQHPEYAQVLAEALDWLAHFEGDVAAAAEHLGVSSSQLLKLVQTEPLAWNWLQQLRDSRGLNKLHRR